MIRHVTFGYLISMMSSCFKQSWASRGAVVASCDSGAAYECHSLHAYLLRLVYKRLKVFTVRLYVLQRTVRRFAVAILSVCPSVPQCVSQTRILLRASGGRFLRYQRATMCSSKDIFIYFWKISFWTTATFPSPNFTSNPQLWDSRPRH